MSPAVEGLRCIEFKGEERDYFTVKLEDPAPFDPSLFGERVKATTWDGFRGYECKFVVNGGVLYIFPHDLVHRQFVTKLGMQNLQCGSELIVPGENSKNLLRRTITGYSISLTEEGKKSPKDTISLNQIASDRFKMGPLREKLGEFFDFS